MAMGSGQWQRAMAMGNFVESLLRRCKDSGEKSYIWQHCTIGHYLATSNDLVLPGRTVRLYTNHLLLANNSEKCE